jgi:penicillin-binding protein 1A
VLAHDTDNIPPIPGIAPHPVQVAEQERLAQIQKAAATNTDTEAIIAAPTAESVKDMSSMTRQVLENLGTILKQAPALEPSDTRPQNRAEAPASQPAQGASDTQPNVASAAPGASPPKAPAGQETAVPETGATAPPQ